MRRLFLLFCVLVSVKSGAQEKLTDFHIGYSANSYKGDFSGYGKFRNALSLGVILNREKKVGGELDVRIGAVVSESLSFESPVSSYVKTNYFSLNYGLNMRLWSIKDKLSFHLVPGLGIIRFNPKDFSGNELLELTDTRDKGEDYSNVALILPVKLQTRYQLSPKMGVMLETGFLNSRTDYLDNISNLADNTNKDNVVFFNFSLTFGISKKGGGNVSNLKE